LDFDIIRCLEASYASCPMPSTAVVDTGSPLDVVGEAWSHRRRPAISSPTRPTGALLRFGKDTPPLLGSLGLILSLSDTQDHTHTFALPSVLVVASDHILLLVVFQTCARCRLLIDAAASSVSVKGSASSFRCSLSNGHLCLPPAPLPASTLYNAYEMAKIHCQFGHSGADRVVAAFPPGTFPRADVADLKRIVASCDACRTHAQLPRRPKYSAPQRPASFNRVVLPEVFSVEPSLPKVLDSFCVDTDFSAGSFLADMRAELVIGVLYMSWLTRYDLCETVFEDRGSSLHAPAVANALHSMGIHLRVAQTRAPWSIEKNERHHGPVRSAVLRARAESPAVHVDLLLALVCKARNAAPRASGVSPTTTVFGERPRLLVGDNAHWDSSCAARARAAQAASAAMEVFTVRDRLQGALSHPGATVPYVTVGKHELFHRAKAGWQHARVSSIDSKNVDVTRDNRLYSVHESRVKPYVDSLLPAPLYEQRRTDVADRDPALGPYHHTNYTSPLPPKQPPSHPAPSDRPAPTPPPPSLASSARFFHASGPANPPTASHHNSRWHPVKVTEVSYFKSLGAVTAVPISSMPRGTQIFPSTWRCTENNERGNGKAPLRARSCMQGRLARDKDANVSTAPVVSLKAIRTVTAATAMLSWDLRTEEIKRAYLQADRLAAPINTRIPPEAGEPDDCVWAFTCSIYVKDDAGRHVFFTQRKAILSSTNLSPSHIHEAVYYSPRLRALCTYSADIFSAGTPLSCTRSTL